MITNRRTTQEWWEVRTRVIDQLGEQIWRNKSHHNSKMEIPLIVTKRSSGSAVSAPRIGTSNPRAIAPITVPSRPQIISKANASLKRTQELTKTTSSVVIDEQVSKIAKLFNDRHVECCKLTYDLNEWVSYDFILIIIIIIHYYSCVTNFSFHTSLHPRLLIHIYSSSLFHHITI